MPLLSRAVKGAVVEMPGWDSLSVNLVLPNWRSAATTSLKVDYTPGIDLSQAARVDTSHA